MHKILKYFSYMSLFFKLCILTKIYINQEYIQLQILQTIIHEYNIIMEVN